MEIKKGQQAPEFALYNTEKKLVRLKDYEGRAVLILFFPFAFSSTCTAELCSVRDSMADFNDLTVDVIGISVDSLYALKAFKTEKDLQFELLSDFNKEVCQSYGSFHQEFSYGMKGVSKRSAFVIDKDGEIAFAEVLENPGQQPDFDAIKSVLQALV